MKSFFALALTVTAAASLVACSGAAPERRAEALPLTTQVMGASGSDTQTVAQIRQALLADRELSQYVIDVDTKDGLVILSGVAPDADARERATAIARALPQVHDIANQLTLPQA